MLNAQYTLDMLDGYVDRYFLLRKHLYKVEI